MRKISAQVYFASARTTRENLRVYRPP